MQCVLRKGIPKLASREFSITDIDRKLITFGGRL